jgi:hypothetical protein
MVVIVASGPRLTILLGFDGTVAVVVTVSTLPLLLLLGEFAFAFAFTGVGALALAGVGELLLPLLSLLEFE